MYTQLLSLRSRVTLASPDHTQSKATETQDRLHFQLWGYGKTVTKDCLIKIYLRIPGLDVCPKLFKDLRSTPLDGVAFSFYQAEPSS